MNLTGCCCQSFISSFCFDVTNHRYKRWRQHKYSQQDIPLKEMGLEQVENNDEIKEGEPDERDTVFISK